MPACWAASGNPRRFYSKDVVFWRPFDVPDFPEHRYQALALAPEFLIKGRDYLHFTGSSKPWVPQGRRLERYPGGRWGYELWHAEFKALAAATPEHLKGLVDVSFPLRGPSAGLYR